MKRRKKIKGLLLCVCLLLTIFGCSNTQQDSQITFNSLEDIVVIPEGKVEDDKVIYNNILINATTKETQKIFFEDNIFINDIFSGSQSMNTQARYYSNKVIYGGLNAGGKSIILTLDEKGYVVSQTYPFNIIYYDEAQDIYVRQSLSDEEQGFYYLDSKMNQIGFIPLSDTLDMSLPFSIDIFALDKVVFFGKTTTGEYALLKYNFNSNVWEELCFPIEIGSHMELYVDFVYSKNRPDELGIYVTNMIDVENQQVIHIDTLYFINMQTEEVHANELVEPKNIVQVSTFEDKFIAYDKDTIDIYKYDIDSVQLEQTIYVEEVADFGEQHINSIININRNYMIVNTPTGIFKWNFDTKSSELIYSNEKR